MRALSPLTAERLKPLPLSKRDRLSLQLSKDGTKYIAQIYAVDDSGRRSYPTAPARDTFPQRIPEKKQLDGMNVWEFGACDTTSGIIHMTWPADQIEFADGEVETLYRYHLADIITQEKLADIYAQFKIDKIIPPHDLEIHPELPLTPHQQIAALMATKSAGGFGLFMEQGTGKTPTTISVICTEAKKHYAKTGTPYRAIIVCPKNVRNNWLSEFQRFTTLQGNVTIMRGGKIRRMKQMAEAFCFDEGDQFTVLILGYETLVKSWDIVGLVNWDRAVTDEGHMYKGHWTTRWKFIQQLRDVSKRRLTLTGTPIENTEIDLFCQFEFMDKGGSGFTNVKAWRQFYGVFVRQEGSQHEKLIGCQNLPFMQERLARKTFQVTKKEVMPDLPDQTYDIVDIEMSDYQRDIYNQASESLAVEIENELSSSGNKSLMINNILTKLLRLNQITSGFISWDPNVDLDAMEAGTQLERTIEFFDPCPKMEQMIEMIKAQGPNSKTVVWCCWVPMLFKIRDRLAKEGIKFVLFRGSDAERQAALDSFAEDRECKVFVGNQSMGGTGLNLLGYPPGKGDEYETNADLTIHYAQGWGSIKRQQTEARNHRMGTRVSIRNADLCVPGSIDMMIHDRIQQKRQRAMDVQDIREILNAVKNGLDEVNTDE